DDDRRRDDRREDTEDERARDRERERAVDRGDDLGHERRELRACLRRRGGEDRLPQVTDSAELLQDATAAGRESRDDLWWERRCGELLRQLLHEPRAEDRAGDREADGAAELLEEGEAAGRGPDLAGRD